MLRFVRFLGELRRMRLFALVSLCGVPCHMSYIGVELRVLAMLLDGDEGLLHAVESAAL